MGFRLACPVYSPAGEVAALCDQVNIERRLSGDDSDQACGGR